GVRDILYEPLVQLPICQLHLSRLKQVFGDVVDNLLVSIESRVAAVEQRVRINRADNRFLCLQRNAARQQSGRQWEMKATMASGVMRCALKGQERMDGRYGSQVCGANANLGAVRTIGSVIGD